VDVGALAKEQANSTIDNIIKLASIIERRFIGGSCGRR
jgi:hypothetical protein